MAMDGGHLRAGDEDRKRILAVLERNYVDGRLSGDEYEDRVGRALAARTFGELEELLRDLPAVEGPPAAPEPVEPVAEDGAGLWDRPDVRAHALCYLLVMLLLVAIWAITSPGRYFWPIWPMLGWGFALAAHGLARTDWGGRRRSGRRR